VREVMGAMLSVGQDPHTVLDRYTIQQIVEMAGCLWQHNLTKMNVVAYAIGGPDARQRVPDRRGEDAPVRQDGPSIGWDRAHGEWRLYRRGADGTLQRQRPRLTPEQQEAQYNKALAQLFGVQKQQAMEKGARVPSPSYLTRPPKPEASRRGGAADAVAKMKAQLQSAPRPGRRGRRR